MDKNDYILTKGRIKFTCIGTFVICIDIGLVQLMVQYHTTNYTYIFILWSLTLSIKIWIKSGLWYIEKGLNRPRNVYKQLINVTMS